MTVDSTGKLIGTMKQFYRPICGETSTLEKVIPEYKGDSRVYGEIKGENVRLISPLMGPTAHWTLDTAS